MSKKNKNIFILLIILLSVVTCIYILKSVKETPAKSFIPNTRIIVVDKNLNILQIINYTKKEIEPTVRLENEQGMEISMTDYVSEQYSKIKPKINFSKTGVIYDSKRMSFFGIMLPDSFNIIYIIFKSLSAVFAFDK